MDQARTSRGVLLLRYRAVYPAMSWPSYPEVNLYPPYLWNRTSYEAGLWLILEVINSTLTRNIKQEIDDLNGNDPFSQILSHIASIKEGKEHRTPK